MPLVTKIYKCIGFLFLPLHEDLQLYKLSFHAAVYIKCEYAQVMQGCMYTQVRSYSWEVPILMPACKAAQLESVSMQLMPARHVCMQGYRCKTVSFRARLYIYIPVHV